MIQAMLFVSLAAVRRSFLTGSADDLLKSGLLPSAPNFK